MEVCMNAPIHNLAHLFAQIGLANEPHHIDAFIDTHRPMPEGMKLHEACFWSKSQARFLRDEILADADWAEVVDELNLRLHH